MVIGKNKDGSLEYGDSIPRDEYSARLERAKESVAPQMAQALQANAEADAKQATWCKSMVRQLLRPEESWGPAPPSSNAQLQALDFTLLATRQELIDAFGKFTGMSTAWFGNLNDSPKLKAARKYTGQGGRHSTEPLFCPHEVAQWLAHPKRKKGESLSATTA